MRATPNAKPKDMERAELEQIHANISKLMAETMKLQAESAKLARESRWHPVLVAAGLLTAGGGAVAVLSKLFGG